MISGYIITYNNEATIKKALNSFYGICDEIIVCIDGKTTDSTRLLVEQEALRNPIKIYEYMIQGDWSEGRNFALDRCSGDWILTVDADEWFEEKAKEQIKELIKKDCDVWEVIQYSYLDSGDILLTPAIRLFKSGLYYTLPIHETLLDAINEKKYKVGKSNVIMQHVGYLGDTTEKIKRNYKILKEDHPLYNYYTGILQISKGESLQEGINNLLIALDKTNNKSLLAYIYTVLAEAYFKSNEIYTAILCAKQSLKIDDIQNTAHKLLSDIYISTGNLDEALEHLKAIEENSKVVRARVFNDRLFCNTPEAIQELQDHKNKTQKLIKVKE